MSSQIIFSIAVIGGGAAGIMAVNRALLNNDTCIFFSGGAKDKKRSRALWVKKVENIPGLLNYKKGIVGPNDEMLLWLKSGDFGKNLSHISKGVQNISWNSQHSFFELSDDDQVVYRARFVVLCTGMMDVQPVIKGSIKPILPFANTQQANYCLRCDGHLVLGKHTSVIGHSNSAATVAITLKEKYNPPTLSILTHGQKLMAGNEEMSLLKNYGIKIYESEISDFKTDSEKLLCTTDLVDGTNVETQMIFIALGVIVYNQLALQLGAKIDERGFVVTDEFGQSSVDRLYVAGDLRSGKKKQIYSAWDSAVDALEHINGRIRKERRIGA